MIIIVHLSFKFSIWFLRYLSHINCIFIHVTSSDELFFSIIRISLTSTTSNAHRALFNQFSSTHLNPLPSEARSGLQPILSSQPCTMLSWCPISSVCCLSPFWLFIVPLPFLTNTELEPIFWDDYTYPILPATTDSFVQLPALYNPFVTCLSNILSDLAWLPHPFPSTHIFPTLAGWGTNSALVDSDLRVQLEPRSQPKYNWSHHSPIGASLIVTYY